MFILRITKSDFPAWFAMRKALWPNHTDEELTDDQLAMFSDPDQAIFLAWDDATTNRPAQVIGMIEMAIRPHAPGSEDAPIPYIEGWYVAPGYRGKGVGRALVENGEAWGRSKGYLRMASDTIPQTYPTSPAAHAALGFRIAAEYPAGIIEDEPSMHFIKDLPV
jgi:aminoglycoside 6'-N-acetyltransferase I